MTNMKILASEIPVRTLSFAELRNIPLGIAALTGALLLVCSIVILYVRWKKHKERRANEE